VLLSHYIDESLMSHERSPKKEPMCFFPIFHPRIFVLRRDYQCEGGVSDGELPGHHYRNPGPPQLCNPRMQPRYPVSRPFAAAPPRRRLRRQGQLGHGIVPTHERNLPPKPITPSLTSTHGVAARVRFHRHDCRHAPGRTAPFGTEPPPSPHPTPNRT